MAEYGSQAVVWQTAVNPVVALELIDSGAWSGAGVLGPEALPAQPFLDLLTDYGSPWACEERTPGKVRHQPQVIETPDSETRQ
jgi:saccharopine dehydrogenase-like NADP-dependent oxidoreductase